MRLSKRIYSLADKVKPGETAADIGTDHGYVPMLLIKNNISPRVIMSDISEGSLSKAKETFSLAGLNCSPDDFRVGDGIDTIGAGEVDDLIIGGLGGLTIIEILDKDPDKTRTFKKLILQPRKHSGNLRHYLYTNGWDIVDEDLSAEGKFVCEIITAVPSDVTARSALYPETDIRWKYPRSIIQASPELALKRISWKTGSIREQLQNLSNSREDRTILAARLRSDLAYLEGMIAEADQLITNEKA